MKPNIFKSILAILAGFVAGAGLSIGTDVIMEMTGVFPSFKEQMAQGLWVPGLLLLALGYRAVYTVVGSYIGAALAPTRPMLHAMILGIIGAGLSTAGLFAMRGHGPDWYPIALIIITLPCAWLGGKLKTK